MPTITDTYNLFEVYNFHRSFKSPYFFEVDFEDWKKSFENDIDGQGRALFKELYVKAVYNQGVLSGFVQYGKTAFGFDDNGEISTAVSYPVIRNLYFSKDSPDVGQLLLSEAVQGLNTEDRIYAFFHYFGMSCFARHGKLFENHAHIDALLKENGFEIEHENVYYSTVPNGIENTQVALTAENMTEGNQQYIDFKIDDKQVGGCEVHYVYDSIAYLRWIYINGDITGKGIGTKCMSALKSYLHRHGINRLDTDTALNNTVAQHYYEKNKFVCEGVTRSYYTKQEN